MNLADELEALRRVIADNDPNEPIADNGMTVWDGVRHTASYLFPRIIAALRATEPAQVGDADRAFELWFFRDIVDDQRSKLIALMLGGAVAKEATNHGTQRLCLKYILKALRAQGRAEAQAEIVALREAILEEAAKLVERRMEQRFEDYGTREPDTNATYYSGRAGETYEALDEEDEEIAAAIRALSHRKEGA